MSAKADPNLPPIAICGTCHRGVGWLFHAGRVEAVDWLWEKDGRIVLRIHNCTLADRVDDLHIKRKVQP